MINLSAADEWLSAKPRHAIGARILKICIGLLICFRIGTEIPFAAYLWGPHGIATAETSQFFFGSSLGRLLDYTFYSSMAGIYALLLILFTGAVGLIFNIKSRLAALLAGFAFILLELKLPAINDGGDNITRLSLIYMLLMISDPQKGNPGKLKIWLHNIGVVCIIMQLMVLYETSGFMKATGEKWQNGTAMYVISKVEWFSLPGFNELFKDPFITTVTTYVPMFFMILFPVAIFSRFKFLWIFIGIMLHLGIAYSMGLVTFSLVMIGQELFLITDDEYLSIKKAVVASRLFRKLSPKIESSFSFLNLTRKNYE